MILLLTDAETRDTLSRTYRYIMIDEYQDTNVLQAEIVRQLGAAHANVMAVGDDAQSIYSFRGANFRNIMDFPALFPDTRVIVSFFSPSGYEHSRRYPLADAITYIPFDSRRGARRFLDLVRPTAAVMVRYDIWPNHIWELRRRGIPVIIANATMRRHTPRRLPLARSFHHCGHSVSCRLETPSTRLRTMSCPSPCRHSSAPRCRPP